MTDAERIAEFERKIADLTQYESTSQIFMTENIATAMAVSRECRSVVATVSASIQQTIATTLAVVSRELDKCESMDDLKQFIQKLKGLNA